MEFGWLTGGIRIVEHIIAVLRDDERRLLEPSVGHSYDNRKQRFEFIVGINNPLRHEIRIATVRLLKPTNGALRYDPTMALYLDDDRDRGLENAVTVMNVRRDIPAGGSAHIRFIFVPPLNWDGGRFSVEIEFDVKGATERRKRIRIYRNLICTSDV